MAGAAVNVGFYGMWRTLQISRGAAGVAGRVVLLLAGISAVIGIAHAAVQLIWPVRHRLVQRGERAG